MSALIDSSVVFNYICSFHGIVFMISYVCSTSLTCHVSNDYDYIIIWLCYFYSMMSLKFTLNWLE